MIICGVRLPRPDGGYAGDSVTDLDVAVAAGLLPAGVLWSEGKHEREAFGLAVREGSGEPPESPGSLLNLLSQAPPIHR